MNQQKLFIVMVGLPAMGKSTFAYRIADSLRGDGVAVRFLNNGDLRRLLVPQDTSNACFYHPDNQCGVALRERFARINLHRARRFLAGRGQVAILDATNVSGRRRRMVEDMLTGHPVLFIECINDDPETLDLSVARKARLPEFAHLTREAAMASFWERISYYRRIRTPLGQERNYILLDSLNHRIIEERLSDVLPFYERIRDLLVTDSVKNLYLVRHGETSFNLEHRIGGDSGLTDRGRDQARALSDHFRDIPLPYVFTSRKLRTAQTAQPIIEGRTECSVIPLAEFDEIDAGICETMTYEDIRQTMPEVFAKRSEDKYNYVYPGGEGYATLRERVERGLKKALFLSGNSEHVMIVGHQAVNRTILSHFLYRRPEDMPYIYIPQDRYYHIIATQNQKLFELKPYR